MTKEVKILFYLDRIETIEDKTIGVKYYRLTYKNNFDFYHIVETENIKDINQELFCLIPVDESQISNNK